MKIKSQYKDDLIIVEDKKVFKINEENKKIIKLMSDTLYSEKLESVFREIFSNSIDACLMNKNKNNKGIILKYNFITKTIKDDLDPCLEQVYISFRDYGLGIAKENIVDIYCTFFQSTKSDTNKQIGGYGLGCKSPIAITKEYNVYSYYNGIKYSYKITNYDNLKIELISEEETNEDNGIEVTIPFLYNKSYQSHLEVLINKYIPEIVSVCPIHTVLQIYKNNELLHEGQVNDYIKINDKIILGNKLTYYRVFNYAVDKGLLMDNAMVEMDNIFIKNKKSNNNSFHNRTEPFESYYRDSINILNGCIPYSFNKYYSNLSSTYSNELGSILEKLKQMLIFSETRMPFLIFHIFPKNYSTNDGLLSLNFIPTTTYNLYKFITFNISVPIGSLEMDTSRENILDIDSNFNVIKQSIELFVTTINNMKAKKIEHIDDKEANVIKVTDYFKFKYADNTIYGYINEEPKFKEMTAHNYPHSNSKILTIHNILSKQFIYASGKDYSILDTYKPFNVEGIATIKGCMDPVEQIPVKEVIKLFSQNLPINIGLKADFNKFKNSIKLCYNFLSICERYTFTGAKQIVPEILDLLYIGLHSYSKNTDNIECIGYKDLNNELELLFG